MTHLQLGLVVLELYVQAILDPDFHLDGIVAIRGHAVGVYPNFFLFDNIS